jgi:hypothetical protein
MNRNSTHQQPTSTGILSRRAALRGVAGTGLAVTLLAATQHPGARAQATPGSAAEDGMMPNHIVLNSGETQIIYDTDSLAGEPQLTYRGPIGFGPVDERPIDSVTIVGEEIRTEQVLYLGQLVTGYLGAMPDAATFYLTLLLPEFNPMSQEAAPVAFSTLAILTTQLTSIAGPALIEGPLQEYAVVEMEGTAELIVP